jgi:hypothetical protein
VPPSGVDYNPQFPPPPADPWYVAPPPRLLPPLE